MGPEGSEAAPAVTAMPLLLVYAGTPSEPPVGGVASTGGAFTTV
jgi:hypothetical protein